MALTVDFFMGAITGKGFVNYFGELYDETASRAVILKGGPGTGKSTLLKKIASSAEANEEGIVERIHCSSDPSSLDAVLFRGGTCCALDGTSPHQTDPRFPGVIDSSVNLGDHWDETLLRHAKPKIIELMKRKRKIYEEVYRCMETAADAWRQCRLISEQFIRAEKMNASVLRQTKSVLPAGEKDRKPQKEKKRILYAVTPQGYRGFENTVTALTPRVTVLRDEYGLAGLYLNKLRASLIEAGYSLYTCPDVLSDGFPEALLIPQIGRAFVTSSNLHRFDGKVAETITMKQFLMTSELHAYKARLSFHRKLTQEMIDTAVKKLGEIKELHHFLEGIYGAAMNFEAVTELSEQVLSSFGLA